MQCVSNEKIVVEGKYFTSENLLLVLKVTRVSTKIDDNKSSVTITITQRVMSDSLAESYHEEGAVVVVNPALRSQSKVCSHVYFHDNQLLTNLNNSDCIVSL